MGGSPVGDKFAQRLLLVNEKLHRLTTIANDVTERHGFAAVVASGGGRDEDDLRRRVREAAVGQADIVRGLGYPAIEFGRTAGIVSVQRGDAQCRADRVEIAGREIAENADRVIATRRVWNAVARVAERVVCKLRPWHRHLHAGG